MVVGACAPCVLCGEVVRVLRHNQPAATSIADRVPSRSRNRLVRVNASTNVELASGTVQEQAHVSPKGVEAVDRAMQQEQPSPASLSSSIDTDSEAGALRRRFIEAICDPAPLGLLVRLSIEQLQKIQLDVVGYNTDLESKRLDKLGTARVLVQLLTNTLYQTKEELLSLGPETKPEDFLQYEPLMCPSDPLAHDFVWYMSHRDILTRFSAVELRDLCAKLGLQVPRRQTKIENVARIRELLHSVAADTFIDDDGSSAPVSGASANGVERPIGIDSLSVLPQWIVDDLKRRQGREADIELAAEGRYNRRGRVNDLIDAAAKAEGLGKSLLERAADSNNGSADTRQIDIEESPEQKQDEELDVWSAAAGIHARADSDADRGDSDGRIRSDDAAHDETQQYQDDTGDETPEEQSERALSTAKRAMEAFLAQPPKDHVPGAEGSTVGDADRSWMFAACADWIPKQRRWRETTVRRHADGNPTGVSVTWLGTSSGAPTLNRNNSGILLRSGSGKDEALMLVDAGEGTMQQCQELGIDMAALDVVLLTHHHGDHIFGVPGIVAARYDRQQDRGKVTPLQIFGPPGTIKFCLQCIRVDSPLRTARPLLDITVTEWSVSPDVKAAAAASRTVQTHGVNFTLRQRAPDQAYGAAPVETDRVQQFAYCKVTAVMDGYVFRDRSAEGGNGNGASSRDNGSGGRGAGRGGERGRGENENVNRDSKGNFELRPGQFPLYNGLSWSVDLVTGWRVAAAQLRHRVPCWGYVFHEPEGTGSHRPRKVCLLGDTSDSRAIAALARGCDLLSHESTFLDEMADKARLATHSTGLQAGQFASLIQAKTLVLTHFSGRYNCGMVSSSAVEADSEDEQRKSLMMLKSEAQRGVRQGPRSHNTRSPQAAAGGADVTVACAFDGFTWRLPRESARNVKRSAESMEDSRSLVWDDEDWVKQNSLVGANVGSRQGDRVAPNRQGVQPRSR